MLVSGIKRIVIHHSTLEKYSFNELLQSQNPKIGIPPILGFGIGKSSQDIAIWNPETAMPRLNHSASPGDGKSIKFLRVPTTQCNQFFASGFCAGQLPLNEPPILIVLDA